MSIADEIRNMNSKFLEQKTQETLKSMTMEELASEWQKVDTELKPEDKKETIEKLSQVITPEDFQNKLDDYLSILDSDQHNAGDFHNVTTFVEDYATANDKGDIKQRLDNLKNKISERRLNLNQPVNLDTPNQPLGFDHVSIEGNSDIVTSLADKKLKNGKTVSFKSGEDKNLASVTFDKDGHADIMTTSASGASAHYMMYSDGRFGEVSGDKTSMIDADKMNEQEKKAFDMAKEAEKIWNNFAEGKMDKDIEKDNGVNVNEGDAKEKEVTVNQEQKKTSKVHEFNPLINMIDPTRTQINEGESTAPLPKSVADVNADDLKPHAKKEDEEYWKEGDIIDTMFKWLVSGANSATNFCVHQMEYAAGAVWDQFEKDVINAKAEEPQKANSTQTLKKEVTDIHNKKMKDTKKDCDIKNVTNLIENNQLNSLLDNNPAFAALYQQSPHLQQVMSPEYLNSAANSKNAASIISSTLTMTEAFTNKYALASIMDEKIKNKGAFKNANMEEVFNQRKQMGLTIFLNGIDKHVRENIGTATNDQAASQLFVNAMTTNMNKANLAVNQNNDAIKYGKYSEKGTIPDNNVNLTELNQLMTYQSQPQSQQQQPDSIPPQEPTPAPEPAPEPEPAPVSEPTPAPEPAPEPEPAPVSEPTPAPEPTPLGTLQQEAENQRRQSEFHDFITNGFNHEEAVTAGKEEKLGEKRRQFNSTRNNILHGLGEDVRDNTQTPLTREACELRIPFPYRGR